MTPTTEDAIADGIYSNEFGAFSPPDALPLVTTDREFVAMATGVVRGQWEIPPEVFRELPAKLFKIAMGKTRTAIKAAKLLIEMHAANGPAPQDDQRGHVTIFLPHNGRDTMPE